MFIFPHLQFLMLKKKFELKPFCRLKSFIVMESPPRRRRRLHGPSSSSVRRKKIKSQPCSFCNRYKDFSTLEDHLQDSEYCRNLYMRYLKVSTLDGVLLKTFDCLFCPTKFSRLSDHLRTHPDCKERYTRKYNIKDIK